MIRKLIPGDNAILEKFLQQHVETSMFMLSNLLKSGLGYNGNRYEGEYWASFSDENTINGVIVHYWNNIVMMQSPEKPVLESLIQSLKDNIHRPVKGVIGDGAQSDVVIKGLGLSDLQWAMYENEGLYSLHLNDLNIPAPTPDVKIVQAKEIDHSILLQWLTAYNIEALGAVDNEDFQTEMKEGVTQTVNGDYRWGLTVDNIPVSLSGFNAELPNIVQIGPVWTPPEHRSNGYARLLVALTLSQAQKKGVEQAILFTDNPAAIKAYEAIGFKRIGTFCLSLLKTPTDMTTLN